MALRLPLVSVDGRTRELPAGDVLPGVQSVVAGAGVSVDATDPHNPVVSSAGGGALSKYQRMTSDGDFRVTSDGHLRVST